MLDDADEHLTFDDFEAELGVLAMKSANSEPLQASHGALSKPLARARRVRASAKVAAVAKVQVGRGGVNASA